MTSTATAAIVSPADQYGRVLVTFPHRDIQVRIAPADTDGPRQFIGVDNALATDRDKTLAQLTEQEEDLGEDRFSHRGELPEVDKLYDAMNERWASNKLAIAREALVALDGILDGDLTRAIDEAEFSAYAGCGDCKCSPGVTPGRPLSYQGRRVILWVEVTPSATRYKLTKPQQTMLETIHTKTMWRQEIRSPFYYVVQGETRRANSRVVEALFDMGLIRIADREGSKSRVRLTAAGDFEYTARKN